MKVTIVGAGNVGASCAEYISIKRIASQVVLLDIKKGLAEGKALDLSQTSTTLGFNTEIIGVTSDYSATSNSDVVVITSGIPRKPGMTREELIDINAGIVKDVSINILKFSPDTIIVVVSNPMDTMTYLTLKATGISKRDIPARPIKLESHSSKADTYKYRYNLSGEPLKEDSFITDAEAVKNGYVSFSVLDYSLNSEHFIHDVTELIDV